MLKHTDLTLGRIGRFIDNTIQPLIYGSRIPLQIEVCNEPYATQAEAEKGQYAPVEVGYGYGPAYTTHWFRVSGRVPKEWAGQKVVVAAALGSESTIWIGNSPVWGLDGPHAEYELTEGAKGGDKVELYIQSYTGNPQCRVHLKELPREPIVARIDHADLVVVHPEIRALYYDLEFARKLLSTIDKADPAHATLMRALNDVCNRFVVDGAQGVARYRKTLRDALGSINSEMRHTVTAVGHAHLDTAWLWPLEITMKKMAHTTANQLALIERYPDYVFAHSQASQYEWLEKQYPTLFKRVKQAIKAGQWEPVGSMWVEADCNLTGSESLVRQFLYGRRYFREKLGYETDDMWLPDVFGYAAALPQILTKFGIKYFLTQKISWNQFNKFPHNTFWWQGIDGTRIWTHFPPADTYIGDCSPEQLLESVKKHRDHGRSDQSLYLFGWGDGGGGPTEMHLEFLSRAQAAPILPAIESGRPAKSFFADALQRSKDLMTWAGELYLEYHRGTYTSQAANKKWNRESEFLLRDAEWLSCFDTSYPKSYPAQRLEELWKLVLLNQFHDIIPGSSVREVYEDSDRDYAEVIAGAKAIIDEKLASIGACLDGSHCKRPYAVFRNASLSTEASIDWTDDAVPTSVTCGDESLPVQLVEAFGERKLVLPTPSAALGAVAVADFTDEPSSTRYRLKASQSNRRLENQELSVRFDTFGNIVSIQSLEDGTEFIEQGKLGNLFQVFDDHPNFWSAWDVDAFMLETGRDLVRSESFEIVERGPVRVAAEVVKKFGSSAIRQRISLGPWQGIRFDTEIDWHETDMMLKVAFPVNVNSLRATYEIQFGNVERPTHMNTSWDMARFEVCAQKWVDLSEGDLGVALLNDGKYGHDIQGNVMRLSLLRAPKAPDPLCDMGKHRFSYMLIPHFGGYDMAQIIPQAYALNAPLRAVPMRPATGAAVGLLPPFVSCGDRNIVIEAVKKAEDGNLIVVRLYECHNSRGSARLSFAVPVKSATLCNLEEVDIADLEVAEGSVVFDYKPFEIITIKVRI